MSIISIILMSYSIYDNYKFLGERMEYINIIWPKYDFMKLFGDKNIVIKLI